ncbi:hypothetical protein EXU85_31900 [Spirosoma sp. KCTC 42546]|uniref:hypothetical protein n=1 Tax=Spirosoma sp. KCTC 42546 TaxID=2520506 RepID=UPI001159A208|nr:hypothetical protein [Spirosoma sp. KCTC 42546]QDK82965.1 hypothetical protein EXU85_31900 [Spirosoma sp. KCTC 42546]
MKNPAQYLLGLLLAAYSLLPSVCSAQTDSVVVTGRIRHLSARLYRESPTVLISRNNILQASRELVRPAPLNVDGTFRVSLPLIFPQEEMYFNYGRISTAFLASAGTLTIDLDADSLFSVAVPFRFGGVNAQVNQQFARYKAFEATYPNKPDGKKITTQVTNASDDAAYRLVSTAYQAPFRAFSAQEKPYPLLKRWVGYADRYNAAAFIYDKAAYENDELTKLLNDSLRPPNDQLLTAARASAMNRFANYATQRVTTEVNRTNGLTVRALALLLERYGKNLTAEERIRLSDYATTNSARASDLKFFDGLVKRSPDTLQRLVNYELMIQRSIRQFDSTAVDYLAAYWLANSLPGLTLNFAQLLYDYARPQVKNVTLAQSLDELYRLEVKDSTRIRAAIQTLRKAGLSANSLEISPGIFMTRNDMGNGSSLLDQVVNANRGKVIYLLMVSPSDEAGRQAALDAQRLRNTYSSRDFALIYLPVPDTDKSLWPEIATRYNLSGDHLLLTNTQLLDAVQRLRADDDMSAAIINRTGKIVKRNAPLPGAFDEVRKELDKNL